MKLVLYTDTTATSCIDWPTALVGLRAIPKARNVARLDAPPGKVSNVWKSPLDGALLPYRNPQNTFYDRVALLARLDAGEDL